MVNRAVRGGGDETPTPKPVDSAPAVDPQPVAAVPEPLVAPSVPPPRPGRSGAAPVVSINKTCPKCGGDGKYAFKDKRGFESRAACECVGGGVLTAK